MAPTFSLNAPERLHALEETGLLEAASEEAYDRLTRLASRSAGAPVALLTVVGADRQRFVSEIGLEGRPADPRETPLSYSFCQHVVTRRAPLVIEDALEHPLVASNAAVKDLGMRSYLGVPFLEPGGEVLGAFCVIDRVPRAWATDDLVTLADFADVASAIVADRMDRVRSGAALHEPTLRVEDRETLTELLFHRSPVAMALVANDGFRIDLANTAFAHQVGRAPGDLVGASVLDIVREDAETGPQDVGAMFTAPAVFNVVQPVAVAGREYALAVLEDQNGHHRAEARLHDREALLSLAVEAAGFGVWSTDLITGATFWDLRCRQIFGVRPDVQASVALGVSLVHPDDRAPADAVFDAALADPRGHYEAEKRVVRGDGTVRWARAVGQVMRAADGTPTRILGLAADVTRRKEAEAALRDRSAGLEREVAERTEALRQRSEQARGLASALALAEQSERRRIAHALHEDLQQILFGAGLHLEADRLAGHPPPADGAVGSLVERALALTRSLADELAAPGVADGRLDRALAWLATTVTDTHGLRVDVDAEPVTVEPEVCDVSVQLVRELLFNVVKHGKAGRAVLRVRGDHRGARVTVEDAGAGFDPDEVAHRSRKGVGLRGVQDRTGLLGGRVEIDAAAGEGTRVTLHIPRAVVLPVGREGPV